ncbi:MAG: electron transport complex subunit RsxC [Gammaproteobacteria bacterium]|nr:electron transport complex subunit RsxC [Gammaproteobacteria bacterium]
MAQLPLIRQAIQAIAVVYPMAKRLLHRFHGGVFPAHYKSLSARQPIRAQIIPDRLILPLQQPVGQPAELLVKVGSYVKKNQLIARSHKDASKALVVPIHAPTSGTIEAIEPAPLPHASGLDGLSIILKPDLKHLALENVLNSSGKAPDSPQALKETLFNAGIIGMGGAGFPTYAKIPKVQGKVHTLLINGAECEPFITCDDLLMQTQAEEIIQGALFTAQALGAQKVLCGIESNKPQAIQAMQAAAQDSIVSIITVETAYPMGGQKQLIQELVGIEMPQKTHAIDLGLLMMNVATFAAIYRAVHLGEPLTERLVTVSGTGLAKPFNIKALIGTPFEYLVQAAEPLTPINYPLIMGGPMMGFQVLNNHVPVIKTTNCILANPPEPQQMQMPCIRCGECMDACPVNLLPQQMYWHSQAHEFEKVEKLNISDCIECGCCSYVCPSHIPLVQYYRHAKSEIKSIHQEAKAVELAKQRHEFKLARIEREKQEREARLKAKKAAVKKQAAQASEAGESAAKNTKKSSAAAAAARAAAAKRAAKQATGLDSDSATGSVAPSSEASPVTPSETKPIPAARQKAIDAAKKASKAAGDEKNPKVAARNAAMAAAKKRAQAKAAEKNSDQKITEDTSKNSAKEATKKAAMAAAKKRAQAKAAKKNSDQKITEDATKNSAKEAAKKAAMAAAKKRAQAKAAEKNSVPKIADEPDTSAVNKATQTDLTVASEPTAASEKEAARKLAVERAKLAAKAARKPEPSRTQNVDTPSTGQDSVQNKRQKAMAAARKRAAERKAAKQQESN